MKKQLLVLILLCLSAVATHAQGNYQRCGTDEYTAWLRANDPASAQGMDAANATVEQWLIQNKNNLRTQGNTIVIPVVVHVVYNTAAQNISDELIKSQIDVFNEDFGGYNSDIIKTPPFFRGRLANDTGIRFELAKRDPSGLATNGVVRVSTTVSSFSQNNAVKYTAQGGSNAWNSTQYLNMWVCNLSGLLGYAQFPGGTAATDGVVILYSAFGRVSAAAPYNYGRTVAHEVGHWLNLRHIWGDASCGSDLVADTPTHSTSNVGCPSCHAFTCSNQPVGDMYMNYMDYTDDKCMYMFTQGQADRMWATLNSTRASLSTSPGLNPVTTPALDAGITEITSPAFAPCDFTTRSFIPQVLLKNFGTSTLNSVFINYKTDNSPTTNTYSWTGSLAAGATTSITLPQQTLGASNIATDHIFYAWTTSPNGGTDGNALNDRTSRNFIGHAVNAAFPITQGFETTPFPPIGWANRNYDCGSTWLRLNTAAHSGTYSMIFTNFTQTATQMGVMDEMVIQPVDMSSAPANAGLKFWVAYAQKTASATDTLEVFASTDCGRTYTSIYKKWGSALSTAPPFNINAFIPNAAEWREETISLSSFLGVKNLMIAFRNTHGGGNNLYIDDIGVTPTSIQEYNAGVYMNIFPNPAKDKLNISLQFDTYSDAKILMTDVMGKEVYTAKLKGINQTLEVDLAGFAKGVYLVKVETAKGIITEKVTITE